MSEETKKIELGREGLYDARKLGVPKMLVLGVQHTFAMFGATVLVPILTVPALRSWAAMLLWPRWVQMAPPARCCRMRRAAS